jgi:hypothetical protein
MVGEVTDQLAVVIDGDSLGDQIFLDHFDQLVGLAVFGCRAGRQSLGVDVRFAA